MSLHSSNSCLLITLFCQVANFTMQLLWKMSLCQNLFSDRLRIAQIKKNMKDFGGFFFSKNKICVVVAKWQPGVHVPESRIMGIV